MNKVAYENQSYRIRWSRWNRHKDKPDSYLYPHPGETKLQRDERVLRRRQENAGAAEAGKHCVTCGQPINRWDHRRRCPRCIHLKIQPLKLGRTITCFHCLAPYRLVSYDMSCPACGQPFNRLAHVAFEVRQRKPFFDHVKETAIRDGKDYRKALRAARAAQSLAGMDEFEAAQVLKKLDAYLARRQKLPWNNTENEESLY